MIAVIGKLLSRSEVRILSYHSVPLNHDDIIRVILSHNPLTSQDTDAILRIIANLDKIDKWMRAILRVVEAGHVNDVVNLYLQSLKFFEIWMHRTEP
tara:strand:+ start:812 stop:1102 length:291 start_codon:yes stop_codon:yes gene_type:complete